MLRKIALSAALVIGMAQAASAAAAVKKHGNAHPTASHMSQQRDRAMNAYGAVVSNANGRAVEESWFARSNNNGW